MKMTTVALAAFFALGSGLAFAQGGGAGAGAGSGGASAEIGRASCRERV